MRSESLRNGPSVSLDHEIGMNKVRETRQYSETSVSRLIFPACVQSEIKNDLSASARLCLIIPQTDVELLLEHFCFPSAVGQSQREVDVMFSVRQGKFIR